MTRQTPANLLGGVGLQFETPPQGIDIARSLIPAHSALSESGFTSRFELPFARTLLGARFAMGLDDAGQPKFADKLRTTDSLTFQVRDVALADGEVGLPDIGSATVEIRPYTNSARRRPVMTLGGYVDKLVVSPDIPVLEAAQLAEEDRVRAITSAKEMVQIVSATMVSNLATFGAAQFEQ